MTAPQELAPSELEDAFDEVFNDGVDHGYTHGLTDARSDVQNRVNALQQAVTFAKGVSSAAYVVEAAEQFAAFLTQSNTEVAPSGTELTYLHTEDEACENRASDSLVTFSADAVRQLVQLLSWVTAYHVGEAADDAQALIDFLNQTLST